MASCAITALASSPHPCFSAASKAVVRFSLATLILSSRLGHLSNWLEYFRTNWTTFIFIDSVGIALDFLGNLSSAPTVRRSRLAARLPPFPGLRAVTPLCGPVGRRKSANLRVRRCGGLRRSVARKGLLYAFKGGYFVHQFYLVVVKLFPALSA